MTERDEKINAGMEEAKKRREDARAAAPYPFCSQPEVCTPKGRCCRTVRCGPLSLAPRTAVNPEICHGCGSTNIARERNTVFPSEGK